MTPRAVLVGLVWVVLQSAVMPYNEAVVRGTSLTGNHLPACSMIALLFLVLVVNVVWRRLRPGKELQPAELAVVWIMSTVTANVPFRGFVGFLIPLVAAPHYYASPENHWGDLLLRSFRPGTILPGERAAELFYEGNWGRPFDWTPWVAPVLYWTAFALLLYAATIGLSVLFRKQWTEHEKFAFPLLQAPIELIGAPEEGRLVNDLLRNPLLWWGAALPLAVHLVNGLHALVACVPALPTSFPVYRAFTERPWIVMRWWPQLIVSVYFAVVGIAYLIPLDISFSFWFFFLFFKLEYALIVKRGLNVAPWVAASRQSFGAQLVIAGHMLGTARQHLKTVLRRIMGREKGIDEEEPISDRTATLGALLGLTGCGALAVNAGVEWWVCAAVLFLWVAITFCLTWMVINGGMFLVQAPFYPTDMLVMAFGSQRVGIANLTALRVPERAMMRDWGEILMPHVLHAFKVGDKAGLRRRGLVPLMVLSILVCLAVSIPVTIWMGHAVGGITTLYGTAGFSIWPYQPLANWARKPVAPNPIEVRNVVIGGLFTWLLLLIRARSVGFALHPIGFAVGASYANYHIWSSLLVGWAVKSCIIRWSGLRVYRRLRPLFLGLIVGDYLAAAVWIALGAITGVPYRLLPVP